LGGWRSSISGPTTTRIARPRLEGGVPPGLACSHVRLSQEAAQRKLSATAAFWAAYTGAGTRTGRARPADWTRVPLDCSCAAVASAFRGAVRRAWPSRRAARASSASRKQSVGPRARGARHLHHFPRSPPRQLSAHSCLCSHIPSRAHRRIRRHRLPLRRHSASSALWLKLARPPSPAARAFAHTPHGRSSRRSLAACSPPLLFSRLASRCL
jgi:hypothetical protein